MRAPAAAAAALMLALAGAACGGDDENGGGGTVATVTATQTVTATATAPPTTAPPSTAPPSTAPAANRCPDITITPNSGDGIFDITTENVTCAEAEALLRSSDGLRSWRCRVIARAQGRETTACSSGNRVIVFATEA